MNNRETFLINAMIVLVIAVAPWYLLVEAQHKLISTQIEEIYILEDELVSLSGLRIPNDNVLKSIVNEFNAKKKGKVLTISGATNSASLIKTLEINNFMIKEIRWGRGYGKVELLAFDK